MATAARQDATTALLDAAESLLVEVGYAGITVRRLAERAGVNHGLVHYYFGSMEEVFLQTLERFTDQLIERQRQLYAAEVPFAQKWRTAMRYMVDDYQSGYQKIWLELQAMAFDNAEMRERVASVLERWVAVLRPAFATGLAELGVDPERYPTDAIVALVATFNQGMMLERLSGADSGHQALLDMIDGWLSAQEARAESGTTRRG
ncbi:MAG: TetR/AcrR family transcriptional regulator [Acidimicrobiales bacterium]|nr:TetR/AcrR family transcriptional regulator [Acidimicrobiales bacterium]